MKDDEFEVKAVDDCTIQVTLKQTGMVILITPSKTEGFDVLENEKRTIVAGGALTAKDALVNAKGWLVRDAEKSKSYEERCKELSDLVDE